VSAHRLSGRRTDLTRSSARPLAAAYLFTLLKEVSNNASNALHLSATSTSASASRETNGRMEGVTRILYTLLWEAGKDILKLAEAFEEKWEAWRVVGR